MIAADNTPVVIAVLGAITVFLGTLSAFVKLFLDLKKAKIEQEQIRLDYEHKMKTLEDSTEERRKADRRQTTEEMVQMADWWKSQAIELREECNALRVELRETKAQLLAALESLEAKS